MLNYCLPNTFAALEHVNYVFTLPAAAPDYYQFWGLLTHDLDELSPYMQHEPVILSRFDRAEHHEIWMVEGGGWSFA
ncbi:hypothetical protein WT56_24195 [Burkholderia pseudomultivorans]|uniref:Uncharacterized protein n=1 Tax=Burkholderia pseudomultivorans TaxID=1207504 RepID=A0A132ECK0_9BURK|nr:hypothetical protein WT56_24195 [Burkholderia pseudomultivorans]